MSEFDPTDIRGQEQAQAEKARERKLSNDTEESDLRWLMGSKRGRRIVWRLLDASGVFQSPQQLNTTFLTFAAGERNYGLKLLHAIHSTCPELYSTMVKERHGQRNADDDRAAST